MKLRTQIVHIQFIAQAFSPEQLVYFPFPHVFQELMVTQHFGENKTWSLPQVDQDVLLNWFVFISNSQLIFDVAV